MRIFVSLILLIVFLFCFSWIFSYDSNIAHPYLTEKAVELFNQSSEIQISGQQLEWLKQGAIEEDTIPRWMNHFYNPITNKGLGIFASSKVWAQSPNLQKAYFLFKGDQTWQKAIDSYVKKDKKSAFIALGHILHLIEDMAVPAHTRDDAHPEGDPYESWAKNNAKKNFEGVSVTNFNNLDNFFDLLAGYSNKYFLSKDTININNNFQEKIIDKKVYLISQDDQNKIFKLIEKKIVSGKISYNIENDFVHSDYYSLLAPKAISYGAGVIDLFFKEIEKEEQKQQEKSWLDKLKEKIGITQPASPIVAIMQKPTYDVDSAEEPELQQENQDVRHSVANNPEVNTSAEQNVPQPKFIEPLTSNNSGLPYQGFGGGVPPPAPPPGGGTGENQQEAPPSSPEAPEDKTPPNPPVIISPNDFSQTFTSADIIFLGTAEASSVVSNDFNTSTTTTDLSGNWSLTLFLNQGTTTIKFFATDEAENVSGSTEISLFVDSISPNISSFSISECSNSFSPDGCVIATTTLHLFWQSQAEDLDYFELVIADQTSTTTATSTVIEVQNNSTHQFSIRAKDKTGNWSELQTTTVVVYSMPVVINEVAWMGTPASSTDEWIELYNRTSQAINLDKWTLYTTSENKKPYIPLSGTISANGYYLLERKDDKTVSDVSADLIYGNDDPDWALNNSGEIIILSYASTTIDQTTLNAGRTFWPGGTNRDNYSRTMERYDANVSGNNPNNWGTNNMVIKNSKDAAGGIIYGTPKAKNSISYLINRGQNVSSSITLTKANSPYLVNNQIQIFSSSTPITLTIEPGVMIKFYNGAGMRFFDNAKIIAKGTASDPIVFTGLNDDEKPEWDIDGIISTSTLGAWHGIVIDSNNIDSVFSHTIFRYGGGRFYAGHDMTRNAMLYIENTSANITNSTFEYSEMQGLSLVSSTSTVSKNLFQDNGLDLAGGALLVIGGGPIVQNNKFYKNRRGIYLGASSALVDSNIFESNSREAIYSTYTPPNLINNSGSNNGTDAIILYSGSTGITTLNSTTTLNSNPLPYVLDGIGIVNASSTLIVEKDAEIKNGQMNVQGTLIIKKEDGNDFLFTSTNVYFTNGTNTATTTPPGL